MRKSIATQEMYVRVGAAIYTARRHESKLTRAQLARSVGVSEQHLQRVEEGVTPCSLHLLVAIADELDTTLDALVPVAIDRMEFADVG